MIAPIEAIGLGKRYGRTWALRDCSIRVPAGKIVGLVGPNGAGKTTFIHLVAGILRPTCGQVRVFGRSPEADALILLDRVGFVAQDAPPVGEAEAHEARAQVLRPGFELHQDAFHDLASDFLEEVVLGREVAVDGLLGDARALRDAIDARAVAFREEGGGGGAQDALAIRGGGDGGHGI